MNWRYLTYFLTRVLLVYSLFPLLTILLALFVFQEPDQWIPYFDLILITLGLALILFFIGREPGDEIFSYREAIATIVFTWLTVPFLSALPLYFSGDIPGFIDCLFESVSGLTTTGASILPNIEILHKTTLFWRSLLVFIGGGGIVIFTVIIIQNWGTSGMKLFAFEAASPMGERKVDRIKIVARNIWVTYLTLNIACTLLLILGGMYWFEALTHSFSAIATGGYSTLNNSIGTYAMNNNPNALYYEIVLMIFMVLGATPFVLHFQVWFNKRWKNYFSDAQFMYYITYLAFCIGFVTINLNLKNVYEDIPTALRHASFSVISIMTTTGFATVEFANWPLFSRTLLIFGMFFGGSFGSTAGGFKVLRIRAVARQVLNSVKMTIHPNRILPIRISRTILDLDEVKNILTFILLFMITYSLGILALSYYEENLETIGSAAISAMSGVGPGTVPLIGGLGNYSSFHPQSKIILICLMLLGRLEIFPIIAMLQFRFWRK